MGTFFTGSVVTEVQNLTQGPSEMEDPPPTPRSSPWPESPETCSPWWGLTTASFKQASDVESPTSPSALLTSYFTPDLLRDSSPPDPAPYREGNAIVHTL